MFNLHFDEQGRFVARRPRLAATYLELFRIERLQSGLRDCREHIDEYALGYPEMEALEAAELANMEAIIMGTEPYSRAGRRRFIRLFAAACESSGHFLMLITRNTPRLPTYFD